MTSTHSSSVSEITGLDYVNGFRSGFVQRNGDFVREILSVEVVKDRVTGRALGDIDMSFEITRDCSLKSLFPPASGLVQIAENDITLPAHSRLVLELTASRGEIITSSREGKEPKLTKKVKFFNYLLQERSDLLTENDFVLIIYNGNDPTSVWQDFNALKPKFRGGVVHFRRNKMISWAAEEREREAIRAKEAAEELVRQLEDRVKALSK